MPSLKGTTKTLRELLSGKPEEPKEFEDQEESEEDLEDEPVDIKKLTPEEQRTVLLRRKFGYVEQKQHKTPTLEEIRERARRPRVETPFEMPKDIQVISEKLAEKMKAQKMKFGEVTVVDTGWGEMFVDTCVFNGGKKEIHDLITKQLYGLEPSTKEYIEKVDEIFIRLSNACKAYIEEGQGNGKSEQELRERLIRIITEKGVDLFAFAQYPIGNNKESFLNLLKSKEQKIYGAEIIEQADRYIDEIQTIAKTYSDEYDRALLETVATSAKELVDWYASYHIVSIEEVPLAQIAKGKKLIENFQHAVTIARNDIEIPQHSRLYKLLNSLLASVGLIKKEVEADELVTVLRGGNMNTIKEFLEKEQKAHPTPQSQIPLSPPPPLLSEMLKRQEQDSSQSHEESAEKESDSSSSPKM